MSSCYRIKVQLGLTAVDRESDDYPNGSIWKPELCEAESGGPLRPSQRPKSTPVALLLKRSTSLEITSPTRDLHHDGVTAEPPSMQEPRPKHSTPNLAPARPSQTSEDSRLGTGNVEFLGKILEHQGSGTFPRGSGVIQP